MSILILPISPNDLDFVILNLFSELGSILELFKEYSCESGPLILLFSLFSMFKKSLKETSLYLSLNKNSKGKTLSIKSNLSPNVFFIQKTNYYFFKNFFHTYFSTFTKVKKTNLNVKF